MPSEFENWGNVILEGLIRYIPCIATKGAPWEELETHRCGWWVDYSQDAITNAVEAALHTPEDQLSEMGRRGYQLVENNYSIEAIASKMLSLYQWVVKQGDKDSSFIFE